MNRRGFLGTLFGLATVAATAKISALIPPATDAQLAAAIGVEPWLTINYRELAKQRLVDWFAAAIDEAMFNGLAMYPSDLPMGPERREAQDALNKRYAIALNKMNTRRIA